MEKSFFVYILASRVGGTLYVGVTSNLPGRTYIHREDLVDGFTRRYGVHSLVYFEPHHSAEAAITRDRSRSGIARGRSG
jgi:putative endonuclease